MNNGIDYREESPGKEGATDEEILILDTLSFFTKKNKKIERSGEHDRVF